MRPDYRGGTSSAATARARGGPLLGAMITSTDYFSQLLEELEQRKGVNAEQNCSWQACIDGLRIPFLLPASARGENFEQKLLRALQSMELLEDFYSTNMQNQGDHHDPAEMMNQLQPESIWRLVPPARYLLDKLNSCPWAQATDYGIILDRPDQWTFLINAESSFSELQKNSGVAKAQAIEK
ncbi:unnamed protein product, partial [Amoebophrya sp. A120]|eukprot:GSA120T00005915001.1